MKSLIIAFSMYSRIPMPVFEWKDKDYKRSICFLPMVGFVIACAQWGWLYLCRAYISMAGPVAAAIGLWAIPLMITGGIHADGYIDTQDAINSFKGRDERLEILKDPHVGAFGIIRYILATLLYIGAAVIVISMGSYKLEILLCASQVTSRILSGLAAVSIVNARGSGMLYDLTGEGKNAAAIAYFAIIYLIWSGAAIYLDLPGGVIYTALGAMSYIYYRHWAMKLFGGITGDLEGYYLTETELFFGLAAALIAIIT
ncbi:adenosylcobinamide-GDP ribazoletransferase [Butyrivibrio sp. MC2013]|uniref:adenosylcobinamide-GDP ribazoletransferase n=1 Tax=Butyrivibrio sp. MC2013 TaxID=1280686 RepID=UPI0004151D5E|nr:adenosylcobinamide-GDP ribazoletransferase [Butyrivibrio sp. MC2013]